MILDHVIVGDAINQAGRVAAGGAGEPTDVPDLLTFSAAVGALMPPLVAIVNQPRWGAVTRCLIVLASCVGLGAATAALEGRLTGDRWVTSVLIVGGAAVAAYRTFWRRAATVIEYRSSGVPVPGAVNTRTVGQ